MLRPALVKAVVSTLDNHPHISRDDFIVTEYTNKSNEPCLGIKYRYVEDFYFNFHVPLRRSSARELTEAYWFNCSIRPGVESVEETLLAEGRDGLTSEIKAWLKRIYEDIISAPAMRELKEHAAAIEQITEKLRVLPDEPLSREDIEALAKGLDALKTELTEEIKKESEDKQQLKRRVDELGKDIEFLKKTLESLSKRQWGELFATRVQRWKQHFSHQLKAGARVFQLLLPDDGSEPIDVKTDKVRPQATKSKT